MRDLFRAAVERLAFPVGGRGSGPAPPDIDASKLFFAWLSHLSVSCRKSDLADVLVGELPAVRPWSEHERGNAMRLPITGDVLYDFILILVAVIAGAGIALMGGQRWGWLVLVLALVWAYLLANYMWGFSIMP